MGPFWSESNRNCVIIVRRLFYFVKNGKTLLIMDEVDGMLSGDRGGTAALIKMIKTSKVPFKTFFFLILIPSSFSQTNSNNVFCLFFFLRFL